MASTSVCRQPQRLPPLDSEPVVPADAQVGGRPNSAGIGTNRPSGGRETPTKLPPLDGRPGSAGAAAPGPEAPRTPAKPPGRQSPENGASPKTRQVRAAINSKDESSAPDRPYGSESSVAPPAGDRQSVSPSDVRPIVEGEAQSPKEQRSGRSQSKASVRQSKAEMRKSLVWVDDEMTTQRVALNLMYFQVGQAHLWNQMQRRTSCITSIESHHETHNSDLEAGVCDLEKRIARTSMAHSLEDDRRSSLDGDECMQKAAASVQIEDEDEDEVGDLPDPPKKTGIDPAAKVRRQSVYILNMDPDAEQRVAGHASDLTKGAVVDGHKADVEDINNVIFGGEDEGAPPAPPAEKSSSSRGPNPLKDCLTAKKVNVTEVQKLLESLGADVSVWLEAPIDVGPPLIARPLVHAISQSDVKLVRLLIDSKADLGKYDGTTMYKGWVKPGATLIHSVVNRKGRFKGTMLAEKLEKIEVMLEEAIEASGSPQKEETAAENDAEAPVELDVVELPELPGEKGKDEKHRRKSFAVRTALGETMTHTQGHPSLNYEIMEHLGDGDTSSCWFGWHKTSKVPCAIKAEHKSDEVWLWEEINIIRKIEHCNINKLYETFENDTQVFMVLELCEGGRLFDRLADGKDEKGVKQLQGRTCGTSIRLMRQLCESIKYLHSRTICHRDIQLDNFLLVDERPLDEAQAKLIDFTTAKEFGPGQAPMKTKICTPGYVAKEILSRKETPYNEKVDVWSLGVVFFIILCGSPPFFGDTDFEVLKKVKNGKLKFEPEAAWAEVPANAKALVKAMICPKVEERLSAPGVLEHAWLVSKDPNAAAL